MELELFSLFCSIGSCGSRFFIAHLRDVKLLPHLVQYFLTDGAKDDVFG